ncbi:VWA containing CoxE family protein [Gemmatirosa kalamazoonensis]|uniref:VWA containing CoxE family protein n=1 Tax=Gemmatirosa kalamazoonensis TaxID=861299 RepID=W0RG02_9BACT|nr:VWA containing CoxE family protein [Gemmatirosa kalamazoonensis]
MNDEAVTTFCRSLRARGLLVTPGESIDAVRALRLVDAADRDEVYFALRALLTSRAGDGVVFDELFAAWWDAPPAAPSGAKLRGGAPRAVSLERWATGAGERTDDAPSPAGIAAASAGESQRAKDFGTYRDDELDAIVHLATRIARRLTSRPSRRWMPARRGERLHLARTMRRALAGDVVELARRTRKRRRTKLIALCDVSGSMDLYSRFLLQLLYALQHAFARVESFVFSTSLRHVSAQLALGTYREALDRLAHDVSGWSGGTRIGESLAAFVDGWPRLVDRRTVVVVLSDGWDTGEPAVLAGALAAIRRRAGRVVWLNPLLGSPGYEPLTRGMQAALPHVDVFAPVHNLESLERLVAHLSL